MSDDELRAPPPPKPKLRMVPPIRKSANEKMTVETYRAAEEWWCKNTRSINDLARFLQVSKKTAARLVHKGLQLLKLRPLSDAAREYDQAQEQARQRALRAQVDLEGDELARARRSNLQMTQNLRVLGTEFLVRIRTLMQGLGPINEPVQGDAAVASKARAMAPLATMFRQVSMALREASTGEYQWIKGTAPVPEEDARANAKALLEVTDAQWRDYYLTGEWPPGMNPDVMRALLQQGFGPMKVGG